MKTNKEVRNFSTEIRLLDNESRLVHGLAIPVGQRSELLADEFYEIIAPTAITDEFIQSQDISLYINHDMSQGTYARSKYGVGSLKLYVTERGLEFETELPQTVFGDALLEGIKRGDYDSMSFAFFVGDDEWSQNEDGYYTRTILSFDQISECSILSVAPAYSQTHVDLRSLQEIKDKNTKGIIDRLNNVVNEINILSKPI